MEAATLKVMIFIEPLIEFGTPLAKGYWVDNLVPKLAASMKMGFEDRIEITLVSGATFTPNHLSCIDHVVRVDPTVLVDLWTQNPDHLLMRALRWPAGPEAKKLAQNIRSYVPEENFDVIIAFGSPAYLSVAFRSAAIMFHEYSFFKAPGPPTWYFDPSGPGGSAWLDIHWKLFKKHWSPSPNQLQLADDYRCIYRKTVKSMSRPSEDLLEFCDRYPNTVLLPLQVDGVSSFTAISPISSQFNLALAISQSIALDTGLVISEHPRGLGGLNTDGRIYLNNRNNVFFASSVCNLGPSDSVAPHVGSIATVSSTAGMLAIMWSKTLISLSGNYMTFTADQIGAPPWTFRSRNEDDDLRTLSFLMSHWAVPSSQLRDPSWMREMILQAVARAKGLVDPITPPIPKWDASLEQIRDAWLSPFAETGV